MNFAIAIKAPGKANRIRISHTCGFWPTPEAAADMAARRLQNDHKFRERWKGFQLLPICMDLFVEVLPNGAIVRHQNQTDVRT